MDVKGPRVIFSDKVKFYNTEMGKCIFSINEKKTAFGYGLIEGIYNDGNVSWKNNNFPDANPVDDNEYTGLQIAFSDNVTYKGSEKGGQQFILSRGYEEEPRYFGNNYVKVIFDRNENLIWKNKS